MIKFCKDIHAYNIGEKTLVYAITNYFKRWLNMITVFEGFSLLF